MSHDSTWNDGLSTQQWGAVSRSLEAFTDAWNNASSPPEIRDFVPDGSTQLRAAALTELIKFDLEQRWANDCSPRLLEQYVDEFPEWCSCDSLPADLIFGEYCIRVERHSDVKPAEYLKRFPHHQRVLQRLFALEAPPSEWTEVRGRGKLTLSPGDHIDDFELLTLLGRGGFGQVFLARQVSLQRIVAVKISADRGQESQILAKLDHPFIVRIYDQRVLPDSGLRLLYMKYEPGGTLQDLLEQVREIPIDQRTGKLVIESVDQMLHRRGESRPILSSNRDKLQEMDWAETVCWFGRQLASALAHAHQQGILHRDLKPANVLLSIEAAPMIADFNVSYQGGTASETPESNFGGSVVYMSLEQLQAFDRNSDVGPDVVTPASDICSLSIVLWELLVGTRPFDSVADPSSNIEKNNQQNAKAEHGKTTEAAQQIPAQVLPTASASGQSETNPSRDVLIERLIRSRESSIQIPKALSSRSRAAQSLLDVLVQCLSPVPAKRIQTGEQLEATFHLCLHPRARQLLAPTSPSRFRTDRRWITLIFALIALVPNVAVAIFNYHYNSAHIIRHLPEGDDAFMRIQRIINATTFPLGIIVGLLIVWPLFRHMSPKAAELGIETQARLRRRILNAGHLIALICMGEWIIAGIVYPIALFLIGSSLDANDYMHFFLSLLLCGLVAGTYVYFGLTHVSLRLLYGSFVPKNVRIEADLGLLGKLLQVAWVYLAISFLVPWLAMTLLVGRDSQQLSMLALGMISLVGCAMTLVLFRRISNDVDAVRLAVETRKGS